LPGEFSVTAVAIAVLSVAMILSAVVEHVRERRR
jgi:hypothetical protein